MDMVKDFRQYEVYWISLDPTQGSEMAKSRPCVVVSPDQMNLYLNTLIIVPITSTIKTYPWRVTCIVSNRKGSIATDQIKVVDRARVGSKIGNLATGEISALKEVLLKMLVD
jgi:mRNA interferase MazF